MRREIRNEALVNWNASYIEGVDAFDCTFSGAMRLPATPGDWNLVRDCRATRCNKRDLLLKGVAFERCTLDGFGTVGGLISTRLHACVFKQVVLKGRLPQISLKPYYLEPGTRIDLPEFGISSHYDKAIQSQWEHAMLRYYELVEWALDIRQARFRSLMEFRGVPGHLIRRDPASQILIKRQNLTAERCDAHRRATILAARTLASHSPFESFVLSASSDRSRKQADVELFAFLRARGVAESD